MQKHNLDSIQSIYKLSPMQEGILFHKILDEKSPAYFVQMSLDIKGKVIPAYLQQSLDSIIGRYDILRTNFYYNNIKKMRQVVKKEKTEIINYIDISDENEQEQKMVIRNCKKEDKNRNYDLSKDNLIRITLFKRAEKLYSMIISFHHIIMDGWSSGIVLNEFFEVYDHLVKDKKIVLEEPVSYKAYIEWINRQDQELLIHYWKNYLKGYEVQAQIPIISYKKSSDDYDLRSLSLTIDSQKVKELVALSNENKITLSTTIQTAWGLLLQKYNNTDDVVFGTVVSGRPTEIEGIEKMVGLMINTVPVRVRSKPEMSFIELLRLVNEETLVSQKYHYGSLAEIQSASILKNKLIDHVLVYENYPPMEMKESKEQLIIENIETFEQSNYDFSIIVLPGNELQFKFYYNNQVYEDEYIKGVADNFEKLVSEILLNSESKIENLTILSEKEKTRLFIDFNDTETTQNRNQTVVELFEEQVEKNPNHIAVVYGNQKLTYKELNDKANILANNIRKKGILKEDYVAVIAEKSLEMIIGIYGIMKSGAAYVPIDIAYPNERIQYILRDCQPKMILTYKSKIDKGSVEDIPVLDMAAPQYLTDDDSNPMRINTPDDLLYLIYTSGTTGKPKGVMIENRGVANLKDYFVKKLKITAEDKILQFANISFDVSVWEMSMALLCGAELIVPPKEYILEPENLINYCKEKGVNVASLTPNYYSRVRELDLKILITGGTELSRNLLKEMGSIRYINAYGPTETTICATYWEYVNKDETIIKVPIGKPMLNTKVYILNDLKVCGIGMTGELCIAGHGVARGYLNKLELTCEKFVDHPYITGQKMYRTGDLARWLPDGNIEFLGRLDQQVKIRGYRIELAEVESEIKKIQSIQDTAVVARESSDGDKLLVAYVVSEQKIRVMEIKDQLRGKLPAYMLPQYIIQVDKIPLTINGKPNLEALPSISESNLARDTGADFVESRNVTELKMIYIWRDLLDLQNISIDDDFFEIGGNSLLLIKMINEIKKMFNKILSINDLYTHCTIRKISYCISNNKEVFDEQTAKKYKNAVLIKQGKENSKNLFFIPDGTGDPSAFIHIVDHLPADYTCWGLVYNMNSRLYPQNTSIPEEADRMLKQMKQIQSEEPYNLVAFCSGGYIALEMIHFLESQNEKVNRAFFIEVMPLEFKDRELDKLYPEWIKYTVATEISFVKENLDGINYDETAVDVPIFWNKVIDLNKKISKTTLDKIKQEINPVFRTSRNDFDSISFEQLIKHINTVRSAQNAVVQCKNEHKKYVLKTKIDFVFASEQLPYENELSNWTEIFINASKNRMIDGTHFGIMKGAEGIKIAEAINGSFNNE
ncbi:amino acid adenylation domain-containing protein [Enterococcus larvae]|uniref:amino acid adenylation domain-containing protein n=1 Tax=Enterococcus larvae TaxID=2794352 RepID=UPI003F3A3E08